MKKLLWVLPFLFLTLPARAQALAAFPGATGGGAASVGGRGGTVLEVTNLNDSGAGSLRACIQASGPRTCLPRVAGMITNKSRLAITNPYITIPCQAAPGGGLVVGGPNAIGETLQIATHDVIVSYCTWDGNSGTPTGPDTGSVGLEVGNGAAEKVMLANNTGYRWGNKGLFAFSNGSNANVSKVSFYRNFMFTPWATHPVCCEPDNWNGGSAIATNQIDYIQNLMAFLDHRCVLFNIGSMSMVNNVCYDTLQLSSSFDTNFWNGLQTRLEGNLYIDGPDSKNKVRVIIGQYPETGNDPSDCYPNCDNAHITPQLFLKDNIGHPNDQTGAPPIACCTHIPNDAGQVSLTYQGWEGGQDPKPGIVIAPMPSNWFSATDPTPKEQFPIVALADPRTFDTNVAPFVGNYQGLACDGSWIPRRNSLDQQAMNTYLARGSMPMFNGTGSSPIIAPGTTCPEDGENHLPLAYEQRWGIAVGTPSNVPTDTQYTEMENYLWGIRNSGPVAPTVNCNPSNVPPGGNSACSADQQVTWSASSGSITPAGALTAPMTPSTVTVSGTNTNGTGQTPVTVATPGSWTGWLGADALTGTPKIGGTVVINANAGPVRASACTVAGGPVGAPISPQPTNIVGTTVTVIGGPSPSCASGIIFWHVQSGGTPPPAPTVSCAPSSVPTNGTSTCAANQPITNWSATAGAISAAGIFTAPSTAQTVTITGTNANGSGQTPVTVTGQSCPAQPVHVTVAIGGITVGTMTCNPNPSGTGYTCTVP
jgi:hypothetical protein